FEHGDAEALVQRRIDEAARAPVLPRELGVIDLTEPRHVRAAWLDSTPATGPDDAQLDPGVRGGVDRPGEILARLERADCEHVLALGGGTFRDEDVVDGVGHDPDRLARYAKHV